ncbi:MAG: hypothetical protein HKN67_13535 [Saprospiraceae bacterium]|nr:hypothetical protein [Saprospiraceae bacterium]
MITFLRKIRRTLIESNSTKKYFLYAIGEILLVMIGILLALQVNNWNETRKSKNVEHTLLTELHKSIKEDIKSINNVIERNESYITSAKIALNTIQDKKIIVDTVAHHLERSFSVWRIYINTGAYDNLKDYGLHLIQDNGTRKGIISAYSRRARFVDELYQRYDQFLYNVIEPELASGFVIKEVSEENLGMFPINNSVAADQHTLEYLLMKSMRLQQQIIAANERTLNIFETLDEELKDELEYISD